jgi:hypothetical protein
VFKAEEPDFMKTLLLSILSGLVVALSAESGDAAEKFRQDLQPFLKQNCYDCHANGAEEGGLDLGQLGNDLSDPATFAKWERLYDRVRTAEMPPEDALQPSDSERTEFLDLLKQPLVAAHTKTKGTVLRRLNRREYQNTMNDLFGTHLDLESMLPEDGRSHEFDNVGESLGISLVHLQKYMEAAEQVLDAAIADTVEPPEMKHIEASYKNTREGENFIGKKWKLLPDGAVVRFSGGGYPSGMLRGSAPRERGFYRVKVTGYAYQSEKPITFSVGGTSFARGSEKPTYGFFSFPPDKPTTIEFEAWIEPRYMIQIEPYGIANPNRYRKDQDINDYEGPGLAILQVTLDGPLVGEFPSKGHHLIFDGITREEIPPRNPRDRQRRGYRAKFEIKSDNETLAATQSLLRVAEKAFRRPVTVSDIEPYVQLFRSERKTGASFEDSLRTAVIGIFCSPNFLYLQETPGKLDDFQLASRLSYFLTRTTPDEELLALAAEGKLTSDPQVLRAQTERLLNDPRHERFITDFTDNWLDLREMDFTVPDGRLFPEFDQYLRYSMPLETREFLKELIRSDLPVTNIVKSDFAMLNSRLAELYDLPEVEGSQLQKVSLPKDSLRGGLLSQAAIMKVTANGTNTSPVTRGAWVLERILGETPPPPPPGVPGVEPDIRGASTLREILDKHRSLDSCKVCHQKIDPPGFALECFNPIGGFRERYRSIGEGEKVEKVILGRNVRYRLGPEVDASGELPDGREFAGFREFRDYLAADKELLAKTFSEKLLTFATGRELGFSDRAEIERIVEDLAKSNYGVQELIHVVVASKIFQSK